MLLLNYAVGMEVARFAREGLRASFTVRKELTIGTDTILDLVKMHSR